MRKVLEADTVAHYWANKVQSEGRNSNSSFFYEQDTIYSYGKHFAIATHYNDVVLFTTRTYSNTTAKHIAKARAACSHKNIIYVSNPSDTYYSGRNEDVWVREIKSLFKSMLTARKPEIYYNQLLNILDNIQKYFKLINKKPNKELSGLVKQIQSGSSEIVAAAKIAKEKQNKQILANAKNAAKYIELWRKHADSDTIKDALGSKLDGAKQFLGHMGITSLRLNGDNIETSKGVAMPIPVAKRYLANFLVGQINVGDEILNYRVNSVSKKHIEIGCHNIPLSEIEWLNNNINN
jgi:hypothetical protein